LRVYSCFPSVLEAALFWLVYKKAMAFTMTYATGSSVGKHPNYHKANPTWPVYEAHLLLPLKFSI
jgi:hypothetical protein